MSIDTINLNDPVPLREVAEERLRDGIPPPAHDGWSTGVDALNVLHNLAGSPDRAGDALKLLHELQVHQVELAMQQEQMEQSRAQIADSLEQYVERFDYAPVGYFSVDVHGRIIEGNLAGAELFEVDRADLPGRFIESLLALDSRPVMRTLLERLRAEASSQPCMVDADTPGNSRRLQVMGRAAPRGQSLYLTFTLIRDEAAPPQIPR